MRPRTLRGAREKGGKDKDKRVERRKESMGVKALTKKDLSRFWRDTVIEWFPDARALPLSVAQESALWQKQKQFNLAGGKDTFTALVDWSLGHWVEIVRGHFSWMDDPPIEPDAWFFIRQFPEWVRFFSKREGPWRDYLQQSHNGGSSFPASQGGEAAEVRRERELLERERAKLAVAASRAVRQGREKPRRKLGGPLTGADVKLEDINGDYDEQA